MFLNRWILSNIFAGFFLFLKVWIDMESKLVNWQFLKFPWEAKFYLDKNFCRSKLILLARNSFIKGFLLLITFYNILFRFSCLVIPIIRGYWQRSGLTMQMQHSIGLACSLVSFWRYGRGIVVDFTVVLCSKLGMKSEIFLNCFIQKFWFPFKVNFLGLFSSKYR